MRASAFILLAAILLGVLLPPALPVVALRGNQQMIGDLDVCRSAAPALSSAGDMPCLGESCCRLCPLVAVDSREVVTPLLMQSMYPAQTERPPKA